MSKQQEVILAERLQIVEDRLIFASLPLLVLCLILWAIASVFPSSAVVLNLSIIILIVPIFCIVVIRLAEVARMWARESGDNPIYAMGLVFLLAMVIMGLFALVDSILHAGEVSDSRIGLIIGLLVMLALQYRAIIVRYLKKSQQKGE